MRNNHINWIANAIYLYSIDHDNHFPADLPTNTAKEVCFVKTVNDETAQWGTKPIKTDCGDLVDLSYLVGEYIKEIPLDPSLEDTAGIQSGYEVLLTQDGIIVSTIHFDRHPRTVRRK